MITGPEAHLDLVGELGMFCVCVVFTMHIGMFA